MVKKLFFLCSLFVFITNSVLFAQGNKIVVLNLKNGYSVKGVIVEQTDQLVKIKTSGGEIFEYKAAEILNTTDAKSSSSSGKSSSSTSIIPKVVVANDKIISVNIGIGGMGLYESSYKLTVPPIPITFEYVVMDNLFNGRGALGIGGFFGYSASKQTESFSYLYGKITSSRLIIGARGYIHYTFVNKLDTYGGVLLGYKGENTSYSASSYPTLYTNNKIKEGGLALNLFIGCRYFINTKLAVKAELGWGISILNLGVAVKL